MGRCPKDEPTGKNLVCKKALTISEKNWKNLLGVASNPPPPPPLAIGGLSRERETLPKQTKNCLFMAGTQHFSPGDIQFQLVYDRVNVSSPSYLN